MGGGLILKMVHNKQKKVEVCQVQGSGKEVC